MTTPKNELFWRSVDVNTLSAECLNYLSSLYDFGESLGIEWEVVFPSLDGDEDGDYERYYPQMNFLYPLPDMEFDHADAERLESYPLTIIMFFGKDEYDRYSGIERYALALTGGGTDLSWEICAAYILLGFLPPVDRCELPKLAGMKFDAETQTILDACELSLTLGRDRNERAIGRINTVRDWIANNE